MSGESSLDEIGEMFFQPFGHDHSFHGGDEGLVVVYVTGVCKKEYVRKSMYVCMYVCM